MADDGGTAQGHLSEGQLTADPTELDFYGALRRLEHAYRARPRLGEASRMADEPVRLGQSPGMSFQPRAVTGFQAANEAEGRPARMDVSFFGLWGPNGPLPLHLTEYAYQRAHQAHDRTLSGFANVFHHRMLTLLYRAWANGQPTVSHDRPKADRFASFVAALIGVDRGAGGGLERLDSLAMYMATHFVGSTRHPEGLCKLLADYLEVAVELEEFVGEWLEVPEEYCWRLGSRGTDSRLGSLGLGARLGREKWERQFKFRLVVGPLSRASYERLLPGGEDLAAVMELVRRYAGKEMSWEIRLILKADEMQPTRLGVAGRLGTTAYLVSDSASGEKRWQDFTFDPEANHV